MREWGYPKLGQSSLEQGQRVCNSPFRTHHSSLPCRITGTMIHTSRWLYTLHPSLNYYLLLYSIFMYDHSSSFNRKRVFGIRLLTEFQSPCRRGEAGWSVLYKFQYLEEKKIVLRTVLYSCENCNDTHFTVIVRSAPVDDMSASRYLLRYSTVRHITAMAHSGLWNAQLIVHY